jgi:TIR domain
MELPGKLEQCLATLSKLYGSQNKRSLQEIIVNARAWLNDRTIWDDDGGYGHTLYLAVPELLYLAHAAELVSVQDKITEDLNTVHNITGEFFNQTLFEMDLPKDHDWRHESGLLITGPRRVNASATDRIWTDGQFRLFLSHKSDIKKEAHSLKETLRAYGISAFVAHDDIVPTKEWQEEIENALATMDGFAALLTSGFHDSNWTDQEVD